MLNKVILIGRTTKDIELRRTGNGTAVVSFTIAVENRFTKNNDGKPGADFINCVAWSNTAEIMEKYVNKGMLIAVDGRIQTGSYEDKDGKRIYTTDVVVENMKMLEFKNSNENNQTKKSENKTYEKEEENDDFQEDEDFDITDDDLPF